MLQYLNTWQTEVLQKVLEHTFERYNGTPDVALFGVIHVILFYSRRLRISTGFIRINVNKTRISGLIRSLRKKHPTFEDESYVAPTATAPATAGSRYPSLFQE